MDNYNIALVKFVLLQCLFILTQAQNCPSGESEVAGKCFYQSDVTRKVEMTFQWTYQNLTQSYTNAVSVTIKTSLISKFDAFSNQLKAKGLGRYFCPQEDCSNINISLSYSGNQTVLAQFHVDDVYETITEDYTPSHQFVEQYFNSGFFNLQSAPNLMSNLTAQNLYLEWQYYCAPGSERIKPSIDSFIFLCGICSFGSFYDVNTRLCTPCPIGYYQDVHGQLTCKECPLGTTNQAPAQRSLASCEKQVVCGAGEYVIDTNCAPCPVGEYQPVGGTQTSCKSCGPGKVTYSDQTVSQDQCFDECQAGYKLLTNGTCLPCPVGSYLEFTSYQRECVTCPNNLTTEGEASTSLGQCQNIICAAGFVRKGTNPGTCEPCPQNTFRTADMSICTSCGDINRWRTETAGSTSQAQCKFYCPGGMYISGSGEQRTCVPCPQDTYKDGAEYYAASCDLCPFDRPKTLTTSSSSIADCKYARCTKGQEISLTDSLVCVDCDFGYYQVINEPIGQRCTKCPDGTSTRVRAAQSASQCEAYCESGFEEDQNVNCVPCQRGYYKDNNLGVVALFGKCVLCPVQFVTANTGATSQSLCTVRNCSAGEFVTNQNVCQKCARGYYQPARFQTSCLQCPDPESTTPQEGSTSAADCSVFLFRTRIAFRIKFNLDWTVEYLIHSSEVYMQLANRMFKQVNKTLSKIESYRQGLRIITMSQGSVAGHMIAKFNNQNIPTTSADFIRVMDEAVTAGQISDVTVDGLAPLPVDGRLANVYEFAFKQDGDLDQCQYGSFYNYANSACELCPIGYYQTDNIGDICLQCPAGYSTTSGGRFGNQEDVCKLVCDKGQEAVNGSCRACQLGTYKAASSVFTCAKCDPGQTTLSTASISPDQCIASCSPGQFSNNKVCTRCPADTYNSLSNQVQCLNCPLNTRTIGDGTVNRSQCLSNCDISQPCLNGATCVWSTTDSSYTCICPSDYEGTNCENRIDVCRRTLPCLNGGICFPSQGDDYTCTCASGFLGDRCETRAPTTAAPVTESGNVLYLAVGIAVGGVVIVAIIILVAVCLCRRKPSKSVPPSLPVVESNTLTSNNYTLSKSTEDGSKPTPPSAAEVQAAALTSTLTGNNNTAPSTETLPKQVISPATTSEQEVTPQRPEPVMPIPPRSPGFLRTNSVTSPTPERQPESLGLNVTTVSLTAGHEKISHRSARPPDSPDFDGRRNSSPSPSRSRQSSSTQTPSVPAVAASIPAAARPQNASPTRQRRVTVNETPFSMPTQTNPLLQENPADYPFDIPPADINYPNERPNYQHQPHSSEWNENSVAKPPPYSKNDPQKKKKSKKSKKGKGKKQVMFNTDKNEVHNMSVRSDAPSNIYMDIEDPNYLKPADLLSENVPPARRLTSAHSPTYGFYQ